MDIVHEFEKAFNANDVPALVACFTEGATYVDTFFGAHTGHAALARMFERMFREGRDYAWRMTSVMGGPHAAAAEWTFAYVVTDAVPRSAGQRSDTVHESSSTSHFARISWPSPGRVRTVSVTAERRLLFRRERPPPRFPNPL